MVSAWNEQAARYLLATTMCPRCDAELGGSSVCPVCAADLRGPAGTLVWRASQRAADAVLERQHVIAALPTADAVATAQAVSAATRSAAPSASAPAPTAAREERADAASASSSQVSVQSVLAVAGAGLFAIAAIVFTFLNPDIGFATRTTVIAVVTALFLAGAWMLRRRGVRFSAEAIGALGMVFLALDVWAFSELAPAAVSGWVFAALGTLVAALAMLVVAWIARIRTWLWAALVGLAVVPAFFGYAGDAWGATWGHVGVVAVALAGQEVVRRAAGRFESDLRADRVTLAVLQIVATVVVLGQLLFLPLATVSSPTSSEVLARVAALVALAALATLSTRNGVPRFWSFTAGALGVAALAMLPLAAPALDPVWLPTLVPLSTAIGVAATGLVGARSLLRARPVQAGALVVAFGVTLPAVMIALGTLLGILMEFVASTALATRSLDAEQSSFNLLMETELAGVVGLFATALGLAALAAATRRVSAPEARGGFPVGMLALALWVGALGALAAIAWGGIVPLAQAGIGIAAALAAGAAVLVPWSPFTRARGSIRAPFIAFAHAALLEAALITWTDAAITVPVGAVIVAAVLALAGTAPAGARAVYVAVAYSYALVVFATALDRLTILDTIAVLCLTTTLAALVALAATLVRQVSARAWYAILIVTAVPFLIGVASVLSERSGWTALSTGVTFLLALALVLTRRPGLNRLVRSAAAAMLVPALAVVVVCLGAQFLDVSGSPVVLPVIAVIVAVVLPSTKFIEAALVSHGLGAGDAASVRLWIEISSLVTAAIAVVLALVRDAAGLGTAIAVLVILGLGAAATSVFAGRRYGWPLAGASWTGALWCVWAMLGVDVVEPYTLPPALGATAVAAILVARGGRGVALFTSGLACALVPSLVLLAAWGPGDVVAWRTIALLAASVVLLALGWLLTRDTGGTSTGIRMLRAPLLAGALVAASAGSVQAVRHGLERDPLALADPDLVMLPVLGLTLASVALAVAAAWLLRRGARAATDSSPLDRWLLGSRWLYAPALLFLVVGPIAAIRRDWFAIWTLWGLMALLLAVALVMVALARTAKPVLPPFWFVYALAWVTGVTGWSERDLRVEVFSIPLGLAVLAAGIIALRPAALLTRATLNSWPIGFRGSWRLLAPGIVLTFLPSVLATATDPQLYRPIMVIGLALVAILVGSSRKLAAPFILGLAVLPVENIVVFSAQVDRAVGAMPWWITLSTAGAVLLAIAVGSERRTNQGKGVAARLRELD